MLSKEQFENIIKSIKNDVYKMNIRFGIYADGGLPKREHGELELVIDKQLYDDLIAFRKTLSPYYNAQLETTDAYFTDRFIDKYGELCCCDVFDDGFFTVYVYINKIVDVVINDYVDELTKIKVADLEDQKYRVNFNYSITDNKDVQKITIK